MSNVHRWCVCGFHSKFRKEKSIQQGKLFPFAVISNLMFVIAATSLGSSWWSGSSSLPLLLLPLLISPSVTNVLFQTCWQSQHVMALILFMPENEGSEDSADSCFLSVFVSFPSLTSSRPGYRLTRAAAAALPCEFVYYSFNTREEKGRLIKI